jgi:hypothetical protein
MSLLRHDERSFQGTGPARLPVAHHQDQEAKRAAEALAKQIDVVNASTESDINKAFTVLSNVRFRDFWSLLIHSS